MYTSVLTDANDLLVEEFIQMYSKSDSAEEKERIVLMLSEVQDEDLIEKNLDLSLSVNCAFEILIFGVLTF